MEKSIFGVKNIEDTKKDNVENGDVTDVFVVTSLLPRIRSDVRGDDYTVSVYQGVGS